MTKREQAIDSMECLFKEVQDVCNKYGVETVISAAVLLYVDDDGESKVIVTSAIAGDSKECLALVCKLRQRVGKVIEMECSGEIVTQGEE